MLRAILICFFLPAVLCAQDSWRVFTTADSLPDNEITALALQDTLVWAGTPSGLARYNSTTWRVYTSASGLPGNYIKSLLALPSALWVGTTAGAARLVDSTWTSYTAATSSLPSNDIRAIAQWNGRIWFATAGGLASFDGAAWTVYTSKNSKLPGDNLLSLAVGGGKLWVGTDGNGLASFDGANWNAFTPSNSPLPSSTIMSLVESEGRIVVGLWDDNGIAIYHPASNTWTLYESDKNDLADGSVRSLAAAPCGHVWAGTRFGGLTDDRTQFKSLYKTSTSQIPGNYVLSLAPANEDIWIGTQTGLAFLDRPKALYVYAPGALCQGDPFTVGFDVDGLAGCSGSFRLLLSDANGSFTAPVQLDIVSASYPFRAQLPQLDVAPGTGYKLRIAESNGLMAGTSATFAVRATPEPRITSQSTVYLCGEENTIFDAGVFASYLWSNGSTERFLTVDTPGAYSVTVTSSEGCSATSPEVTVERHALPTPAIEFTGATTFCPGDSVVLRAGSYAQYKWSTGETSATLAVKKAGVYSVVVADAFGCTGASQSVEFSLHPRPSKPSITNIAGTLYSSPALSYQWYRDGQQIDGATDRMYKPTVSGQYTVAAFNEVFCPTLSDPYKISITSAGEGGSAENNIAVHALGGELSISGYTAAPRTIRLAIVDLPGRRIKEVEFAVAAGEFRQSVALHGLAAGAYIALCESEGYVAALPFIAP